MFLQDNGGAVEHHANGRTLECPCNFSVPPLRSS